MSGDRQLGRLWRRRMRASGAPSAPPPPAGAPPRADRRARERADAHRDKAQSKRNARAEDDAAEQVAPQLIRAQEGSPRGALKHPVEIGGERLVGSHGPGEGGSETQQE